jgi:hypothetical protein
VVESGGVSRLYGRQLRDDHHRRVGHKPPAVTRRFAIAQYRIAAVFAAVSLVMFFAAGQQYALSPQEYLNQNLASSWLLPLLLYVPLALTLTLVSWAGMRYSSR